METIYLSEKVREMGESFVEDVVPESLLYADYGIAVSVLQGAEDSHENRLCPRPFVTAIALNHFAHNHSRTNLPLRMIIRCRNLRHIQKRQ
jgi:hypothetical protein